MNIPFRDLDLEQYTNVGIQMALQKQDKESIDKANEFLKYGVRVGDVLRRKNDDYGNAVAVTGKDGIYIRMFDKFERVKNVSNNGSASVTDESIADTIEDIAGYALLWLMIHEKSSVFFDNEGKLRYDGDWKQSIWAYKLRESLGLNVLVDHLSEDEYDEIVLCQRCATKSFDSYTKQCYRCDGGLQEVELGGSSIKSPIAEDTRIGEEDDTS